MSRIGKKPIVLPAGVTVTLKGDDIAVKGPKGTLNLKMTPYVKVTVDKSEVVVETAGKARKAGAFQGMTRALLNNMITGVSKGFEKNMALIGVGYKVTKGNNKLVFNLGYSHPIEFPLPKGIEADVAEKNVNFTIKGIDRGLVGQTCATIRSFRPPEPYKGKGIRYANEVVRQKAGKTGAK